MGWEKYRDGILTERGDDTTRTVTDHRTEPPTTRPYTQAEDDAADARLAAGARLDDHEARISAIEAHLWPADPDPEPGTTPDAPTWDDLSPAGWWYDETLLADGGKVWRNVSGGVLTTPPSGFPGDPSAWTRLFVEAAPGPDPDPEPDRPEGYVGPWSADARYEIGDVVDRGGHYYRCKVAHGAEYGGTWGPPQASVWTDLGPVA